MKIELLRSEPLLLFFRVKRKKQRKAGRHFVSVVSAMFLVMVGSFGASAENKPNVLFIISDDLNNDMGTYGHPLVQTPNLDRLATQGLTFDRMYCQYTLCNPSRSSLMSSLYPEQTKIYGNGTPIRRPFPNVVTMPQLFRNNGYFTARVGKIYHYGVPKHIGTDGLDDAPSWDYVYNPIGRDKTEEDKIFTLIPGNYGSISSWLAAEGTDDEQTDGKGALEIMRLLEEQAETDEPFFLAYGIYRPHTPYVAPKKYFDIYDLKDIVVPPDAVAREPYAAYQNAKSAETVMSEDLKRRAIRAYYATTTFMDAQVGRVIEKLEELGLAENTIVVFTSDHGYQLGEHGLWRKRALFERAARAPMIIRTADELSAGKRTSQLVELVDLYPTLAALAGLEVSGPLSGMDLSRVLKNPESFTRKAALTQDVRNYKIDEKRYRYPGNSIRTEQYRYTEWDGGKQGLELYDHKTDPEELVNLAHDKDYADVAEEMRALLAARLHELRQVDLSEWRK